MILCERNGRRESMAIVSAFFFWKERNEWRKIRSCRLSVTLPPEPSVSALTTTKDVLGLRICRSRIPLSVPLAPVGRLELFVASSIQHLGHHFISSSASSFIYLRAGSSGFSLRIGRALAYASLRCISRINLGPVRSLTRSCKRCRCCVALRAYSGRRTISEEAPEAFVVTLFLHQFQWH